MLAQTAECVNHSNCLIENLSETDSLPHQENLSEIPPLFSKTGDRDGLQMNEKRSVVRAMVGRYRKAGKKEKGRMLDELIELTGYNRWYAVGLLQFGAKMLRVSPRVRLKADLRSCSGADRRRVYDAVAVQALSKIWMILDCICCKRLVAILGEVIPVLGKHGEIALDAATRAKLLCISAATIDRVPASKRKVFELRGRSGTKPGTLLKQ